MLYHTQIHLRRIKTEFKNKSHSVFLCYGIKYLQLSNSISNPQTPVYLHETPLYILWKGLVTFSSATNINRNPTDIHIIYLNIFR